MKKLSVKKVELDKISTLEQAEAPIIQIIIGAACGVVCAGAVCGGACAGVGCAGL